MDIYNPIYALLIMVIAYLTAQLLNNKLGIYREEGRKEGRKEGRRFENIDALRGVLALFVFIHHSAIWYHYLDEGEWITPQNLLYAHMGDSSVRLFFMITSFLFIGRMINGRDIDWEKLYKSRFFRIVPLYYFVLLIVVFIVLLETNFILNQPLFAFLIRCFKWVIFGVKGYVAINNYDDTSRIVAGAVWSLTWEWLFYFTLPIWYLLINRKMVKYKILIPAIIISSYLFVLWGFGNFVYFLGGIFAVYSLKYLSRFNANGLIASILLVLSVALLLNIESDDGKVANLGLLTIIYTLIVLGNNVFGLLKMKGLKVLGEISYSIYLLHGIVLFVVIDIFLGREFVKSFTPLEFWLMILSLTPILIVICMLSYKYIELPFINKKVKR